MEAELRQADSMLMALVALRDRAEWAPHRVWDCVRGGVSAEAKPSCDAQEYLGKVVDKLCIDGSNAALVGEYARVRQEATDARREAGMVREERRKAAKQRQSAILAQFAAQRKTFLGTLEQQEDGQAGDECDEQQGLECVICATGGTSRPLGLVATIQANGAVRKRPVLVKFEGAGAAKSELSVSLPIDIQVCVLARSAIYTARRAQVLPRHRPCLQSCGHAIHPECHESYAASFTPAQSAELDVRRGEFWCPLCRRLSNALVPLLPTPPPVPEQGALLTRYASLLFEPPSPAVPECWGAVESSVARLHTSIQQCWAAELGFATHAHMDESAGVLLDYGQRCAVDCLEMLPPSRAGVACVRALQVYARTRTTRDMLHKVLRLWNAVVGVWGWVMV